MKESEILRGEPINGHILIKVDKSTVRKELGMAEDSPIYVPQEKSFASASTRGEVIRMASDAFGLKYQERFGEEIKPPVEGDTVHFVSYQSAKLDEEGVYYLITDDGVKFIERKEQ